MRACILYMWNKLGYTQITIIYMYIYSPDVDCVLIHVSGLIFALHNNIYI